MLMDVYLLLGELPKHTDIRWNDIIPGSVLSMDVRRIWRDLITAAAEGNEKQVGLTTVGVMGEFRVVSMSTVTPFKFLSHEPSPVVLIKY